MRLIKIISVMIPFLMLSSTAAFAEKELVDRVVAVVNGEIILHSDIQNKINNQPVEVSSYPAANDQPVYEQSLQDSINYRLIAQEAEKLGIELDDASIEEEIKRTFATRGLNIGDLMEDLRRQGISYEDYKEMYRKRLIVSRFQRAVIMPQIKITEKDLETYFMKRTGQKSNNVKVTLSQIVINLTGEMNSEVAEGKKKLASKIYRDLQSGLDFKEAVKIYSDDPSGRENGGNMGSVTLNDLAAPVRKAIEGLSSGEYSRPVLAGNSYYIFKLENREFTGSREFEQVKGKLENELQMVQLEVQTQKWLEEKRQRSEVKVIR